MTGQERRARLDELRQAELLLVADIAVCRIRLKQHEQRLEHLRSRIERLSAPALSAEAAALFAKVEKLQAIIDAPPLTFEPPPPRAGALPSHLPAEPNTGDAAAEQLADYRESY